MVKMLTKIIPSFGLILLLLFNLVQAQSFAILEQGNQVQNLSQQTNDGKCSISRNPNSTISTEKREMGKRNASSSVEVSKAVQNPNGTITITHSATQNIIAGNSVACNSGLGHTDNSYLRVFDLATFGIINDFNIYSVDIGIESATTPVAGEQPATMNLYTWDPADPFTFANLTLIGTAPVSVADQALTIINVPITATVPENSNLVVEFFTPNGQTDGNFLFVGSNPDGQTAPSYIAAADCGVPDPLDLVAIGFQDMHLVMNVNGFFASSVLISGFVKDANNDAIEGVNVAFSNGGATVTTNVTGHYSTSVSSGWNGTSTATKDNWTFNPVSYTYPAITTNQTNQNYTGTYVPPSVTISGHVRDGSNIGIEGVAVAFSNGGATVITNATGHYSTSVTNGWSGTSTATKDNWEFSPVSYTYPVINTNQTDQNYVGTDLTLAVEDVTALPTEFTVLPAYPNPFNPSTTIRYGLADVETGYALSLQIQIYDITGKLITTLLNGEQTPGWHSVIWNGTNQYGGQAPAGLYFSKITSGNEVKTSKLMLLR